MKKSLSRRLAATLGAILALGLAAPVASALTTFCAEVKLEILQEATLEREAFDASLKVNNNLPDSPLTDLRVNVFVKDEQGNPADDVFFIKIATLTNTNAIDGSGVVQSSTTAEIRWLIIPSTGAGGMLPGGKRYSVKATINGTSAGAAQSVTTFDDFITVYPQPSLKLEYVLPYEVFGDEPLTTGIEPIEPFPLGVRVTNIGYGTAKNFKIESAQPKIIDNKQALPVDFKLLGTVVRGTTIPDTLLVPFGDVAAGGVGQASWIMTTSLSGRFIEFTSTFTHAAELGGQLTSLIQSVTTYTLLRDVLVDLPGRDVTPDFLVNASLDRGAMQAMLDAGEQPNAELILESDQPTPLAVIEVPSTLSGTLGGSNASLTMTFAQGVSSNIWVHSSVPFNKTPGLVLQSARASDGRTLGAKNVWISKHFRKDDLTVHYRLNILDLTTGASTYSVNFDPTALDAAPGAVTDLVAATAAEGGTVNLTWSAPGEDGYTGHILGGRYMIENKIDLSTPFAPAFAQVNFATSTDPGDAESYALGGLVGNATTYLSLWTQDTGGGISEISNGATAYALPYPPRDLVLTAVSSVSAHAAWQAGNNALPIEYQVFAATAAGSVAASSSPYQDSFEREFTFAGLAPSTTYTVFGVARNTETLVMSPVATLGQFMTAPAEGDSTAPGAVTGLVATVAGSTQTAAAVVLTWTAPGDDGATGAITTGQLDLRYSSATADYASMEHQVLIATAAEPGAARSLPIEGLERGATYTFALRYADEAGNFSAASNMTTARTYEEIAFGSLALTTTTIRIEAPQASTLTATAVAYADLPLDARTALTTAKLALVGGVFDVLPEGTAFDPPARFTMRWLDENNDGIEDTLGLAESGLVLRKWSGSQWTPVPVLSRDEAANEITVEVSLLASLFGITGPTGTPPGLAGLIARPGAFTPNLDELTFEYRADEPVTATVEIRNSSNQLVRSFSDRVANPGLVLASENATFTGPGNGKSVRLRGGYAYYTEGETLSVYDLRDPAQPVRAAALQLTPANSGGAGESVEIVGSRLFVSIGAQLAAIDISTPSSPAVTALTASTFSSLSNLTRSSDGRFLFGASTDELGNPLIAAFDVTGGQPVLATYTALGSPVNAMSVQGGILYTMSQDAVLRLYDLAAPGEPLAEAGQLSLGNQVYDLAFSADGRYLYAASGDLKVVDIAAPASPALVRTYTAGDFQRGGSFASNSRVLAHGDFLYVPGASNVGFIDVFDIRVPTAPVILGQHIFSTQDQDTGVMAASGNTLLALHTKATVLTVRPSGSDRVAWDGRDASGMVVAAGTYTVVVDALDAYGDAASTSTTVVVNPAYATPAVADAVAPVLSAPLAHADPFTPNLGELTFEYRADEAVNATVEIRNSSNQLVKAFPGRLANPGLVVASEDSTFTGPGAGKSVRLRGGYAYYSESDKLSVFDLRDPAHPARAAALQLSAENGGGEFVELAGSRLFVSVGSADGTRLVAVDISTPAAPAVVAAASVTVPSALMHLTRSSDGRFLFGDSYDELGSPFIAAFDISGGQPVLATRTALGSPVTAMNLLGQTLYTMSQDGALRLYDLAAPETGLSETGQLSLGGWAMEFAFSSDGRYLYAATGDLKVVDITVPSAPALVHTYTAAEFQRGPSFASDSRVLAHGNFLFIPGASNVGFMDVFDVIVPTAPVFRGEHVFATQDQDTSAMAASGNTLLALHGKSTVLTVRPSGSDRVAWDGRDASNATVAAGTYTVVVAAVDGSGNTASTSAAFVVNPAYATPSAVDAVAPVLSGLLARPNPFTPHLGELLLEYRADEAVNATVEIRNSSNQLVRTFPDRVANPGLVVASENSTFTGPGNGKSVRMRGGYAYYTENETLSVYDLRDLAQPVRAAALQLTPANSGGAGESVEIVGSRLFVSIGAQLAAIDISTPSSPAVTALTASTFSSLSNLTRSSDGRFLFGASTDELGNPLIAAFDVTGGQPVLATYTALGSPVNAMSVQGGILYTMSQDAVLRLYDLAAPGEPLAEAGQLSLGNQVYDLAFSADGRYLYAASGDLKVVDVAVPASPTLVRTYTAAEFQRGSSFASNSRALSHGNFLYVPGYSNIGFIDVFDILVPTAPVIRGQHVFATQGQDTAVMAASGNTLLALNGTATVLTVRPFGSDRVAWDGRDSSNMAVAPGTYTFVVSALDGSGNAATSSGDFTISTGAAPAPPQTFTAVSGDGAGKIASSRPDETITAVSTDTVAAAYGVAVSSQGLVLVMPSLYELQPSPVVFSPPATLTFRFDAVGVDTTTVSIYRFNGVTWDSAPVTSQQLVAVGGGLFDISGILQSASLYAVFSLPAPAPALASITVTPSSATLLAGTTAQFEVAGTFTDGSTRTLTGEVVWTTDVSSVATVAAGLATGVGGGTAQIIASSGAITGFATLTVTVPPVLTLSSIAPSSATTGTSFAASLTGTGFDASAALTLERLAVAQATWSATGSFTRGSYHGTLTKLRDGRVLLAGGRDPAVNGSYLTNADLYDPATGSWTAGPPMKVGRVLHASVLLADGRVLVTGGSDWPYNSVEIFDPVLSTWTAAAPLANGRSLHGAALLPDGRVLVASGWNGGTEMSSAEIYDPVADTWSPAPPLSTARRSAKMITLSDGKILLAGGEGVATAEVFNPVTNAWGPAGTMSHTRQLHQLALLPNGKVLAAGGWGPVGASSTTDVYDPATNAWTAVAPMGGPRGDHAMVLVNGTPLVIGGRNASAELASTEVYDAAADTWRAGPPLMGTRVVPTAATLADGRVLVAAGYRSNVGLNTAELLAPTVVSIVATGVSAADAQHLAGSFDLTGAATGYWDVVVHQTGGRVGRLEAGLNVLPAAPADVTVPVVSLSYSTPSFTASGGLVTIGTNSLVTLYAMDPSSAVPASGVAQILYAVDSTTPSVTYSAPFNLAAGAHVIYFSATDLAGNASAVSSAALSAAESPFVGAFSPSVGPIGIGYAMAGFGFGTYGGTATRVKFGISTTPVSVWNDASIVGTVPGLSTGTYAVTLERLSGSTLTITSAGAYTVTPMVPSLSVSSGPIGLPFTLTGTGFGTYAGANSRVLFAGTTAPISVWNDSTISGTVPGVAAGTTTVVVERRTADGFLAQSDPLPFTVTVPSVTAVSPSSAPIGAAFTLTGLSFGNYLGANSRVLFDGTTAPIAVWNDDTITGTVPGSLAPGVHELVVERRTADGGVSRSGGDAFVVQGLALASIAPSTGAIGVPFTLTGTGFGSYLGANSRVKFGVSTAAVSVWNDTTIAGTVPTLSTGEYSVTVERQQGSDVSVSNASSFTVIGLSIASVTPSSGPIGTVFTVSGAGFGPYAGVNTFLLLGGATTPVSVWNDTTITATVPGGLTPGVKELTAVRRNTDGGLSVSNTAYFEVTGMGIASLSPSTGPIGIPFTIKGSQFGVYLGANSRVRFGVSTAAVSVWNDTTITGTVPSLATGTHAVVLERQQGTEVTFSDYSSFTVTELAVGTLTPSSGPIGVAFTVTGEHFGIYAGANTRLLLGGTTVAVAVWNDTTITGTVPNLAAGSQPLWLERKSGTGVQSSATTYFLVTTPEVATLTPSSAPIGAPFSITGGNFGPYAGANTRVTFNGVSAPISVWNDHAISGTVPGAVSTGPAALVVERAAGAGVTQCATQAFEVLLPVISTVSPAFGPAGTVVTLTGRGFGPYAGTATKLLVGGSTVAVSVWNDTTIRWTVTAAFPNGDYALVVRRAPAGGTVDSDSATFTVGTGYGGASFGFAETLSLAAQPDVNFEGGLNLPVDEGGRVETPSKAAVEVPPNALEEDTEITLKRLHKDGLRTEASDTAKKRAAGEAIEFGPEGTFFNTPVTIELPYDPALTADESKLAVHYYDPLRRAWEELPSVVDRARRVVRAQTSHFSIYQPMGIAPTTAAQDEFYFRDQYAFPNPSRGGAVTFRIQPGLADTIELRVYDLSGRKIHGSTDFTFRGAIDDGNGKGAQNTYDHVWGVSGVGSGVYRYVIKASRASQAPIVKSGKVGVIK